MPTQFSFEGALSNAFRAAHPRTFPWIFAAVYALVVTLFVVIVGLLSKDDLLAFIQAIEALENATIDESDSGAVLALVFATMTPLMPWGIAASIGAWVMWAVFEAASQRRYVRDERFSVRLGSDELRMMAVGFFWSLLYLACFGLPALSLLNGILGVLELAAGGMSENELGRRVIPVVFGGMGLMLLAFPAYVFFATRLSPCFAMTIKDRKIVFFDAWNVSRGRFWPILGAYLIIAIVGGIIVGAVGRAFEMAILSRSISGVGNVQTSDDAIRLLFSPAVLVPIGLYTFVRMFLSALLQHFSGGPAAFAARHDPRGGVDDTARMAVFD
ncbi:hypothetical protein [Hyphomonas sp.]|uniref:hypothetical protein n=1 Tax=Hyphomonas sp. TaxID=87 RepID=UPI0039E4A3B3